MRQSVTVAALVVGLLGGAAGVLSVLNRSKPRVTVPQLTGQSVDAAAARAARDRLRLAVQRVTSSQPVGLVISQSPRPGLRVDKRSTVVVEVSSGPGRTLIPDVAKLPVAKATAQLQHAGFKTTMAKQPSAGVAKGLVAGTEPAAFTPVQRGAAVKLLVSTGPATVVVPNLVSVAQAQAISRLTKVGLVPVVSSRPSSRRAGAVVTESPAAGARVRQGTVVSIEVASPQPHVTMPKVVGEPEEQAVTALSSLGLQIAFVARTVSRRTENDLVVVQQPPSGTSLDKGATATLTVAKVRSRR
jgi:serine/threonine-protein kinase